MTIDDDQKEKINKFWILPLCLFLFEMSLKSKSQNGNAVKYLNYLFDQIYLFACVCVSKEMELVIEDENSFIFYSRMNV